MTAPLSAATSDLLAMAPAAQGWHGWLLRGGRAVSRAEASSRAALRERWPGVPALVAGAPGAPRTPLPVLPRRLAPLRAGADEWLIPTLDTHPPAPALETAIAGHLTLDPRWDGVVCVTGPQSHWVLVSAEEIVSVKSFLAGDLLQALDRIRPSDPEEEDGDAAFDAAVSATLSRPETLAATLARARGARERAGALVGAELAASRAYWLGRQVAVVAPEANDPRLRALAAQGVAAAEARLSDMLLAGVADMARRIG